MFGQEFQRVPLPSFTYLPLTSHTLDISATKGSLLRILQCATSGLIPGLLRLRFHLAKQMVQWESTESVKSFPGTGNGIPTHGSSRLNALCDYLKETLQ